MTTTVTKCHQGFNTSKNIFNLTVDVLAAISLEKRDSLVKKSGLTRMIALPQSGSYQFSAYKDSGTFYDVVDQKSRTNATCKSIFLTSGISAKILSHVWIPALVGLLASKIAEP